MSIHALVVETPERRIIVDTCLGNDKEGRRIPTWNNLQGPFLSVLAAAGYPRESIDTVLCTHLHVDHVGWNTMLVDGKWVPTFPRARYLMGRVKFDHWQSQRDDMAAIFADSVKPVQDAELVDLVETDHRITGDFIHHPCQIAHPEWSSTADTDPEAAHRTRDRMLKELSERPVLVIGTHFAGATAGRILRDGDAYRLAV